MAEEIETLKSDLELNDEDILQWVKDVNEWAAASMNRAKIAQNKLCVLKYY